MPHPLHGWCGKILNVDLTDGRITERNTMDYAHRFLGGRGIATRIYWEEVGPEVKALDPENRLILMTGPLGAVGAQGASRFVVAGKSPLSLPEGFCYGNMGGFFGPFLKRAGYDGVVISGKSETPVYLFIEDGEARLLDAAELWGQGVYAARDRLKATHGDKVRFVTTGPAGEHLCRSANLMTDNEGSVTGGFGAVFGSKNLKAVAVVGAGHPTAARPDEVKDLNRRVIELTARPPLVPPFPPDQVSRTGKGSCYQCGLVCDYRNTYTTASGKEVIRKCQSMFVYFPWVMRRPEQTAETAIDATGLCNDLSLCTMEMYNVVEWIEAAYRAGYLTDRRTGLKIDELGTPAFFRDLMEMIVHREGFGDILAEGLLRAGEILGEEARAHFSNEVAGVGGGATYSGREYLTNSLLYALEPRQPIAMLHEISRLTGQWVNHQADPASSPVSSDVYRAAARRFWSHDRAWDMTVPDGKAIAAARIMDRTFAKDSLVLCDSCWPLMVSRHTPDGVGDPTLESRYFSAVTGIDMDEAGLHEYGERIFNLQRAILIREGHRPRTDDAPAEFNFTDPVETVFMNPEVIVPGPGDAIVSHKGKTLDREVYESIRREFYELRGWDPQTGEQKKETLARQGLQELMDAAQGK